MGGKHDLLAASVCNSGAPSHCPLCHRVIFLELVPGWALFRGLYEFAQYAFRATSQVGALQEALRAGLGWRGGETSGAAVIWHGPSSSVFVAHPWVALPWCGLIVFQPRLPPRALPRAPAQNTEGMTWGKLGDANNGMVAVMVRHLFMFVWKKNVCMAAGCGCRCRVPNHGPAPGQHVCPTYLLTCSPSPQIIFAVEWVLFMLVAW